MLKPSLSFTWWLQWKQTGLSLSESTGSRCHSNLWNRGSELNEWTQAQPKGQTWKNTSKIFDGHVGKSKLRKPKQNIGFLLFPVWKSGVFGAQPLPLFNHHVWHRFTPQELWCEGLLEVHLGWVLMNSWMVSLSFSHELWVTTQLVAR